MWKYTSTLSQNELEIFYNSVNLVRTAKKVWALKKKYGQNFSYLQLASSWNILSHTDFTIPTFDLYDKPKH